MLDLQTVRYDRRGLLEQHRNVGVVFQNPEDQLFSANVYQDISLGPLNLGMSQADARQRVLETVEFCGLSGLLERPTHALSGGEKARAALAGVLAMSLRFLFADELTNSLDPWMRQQVIQILKRLSESGCAVILDTHDVRVRWLGHWQHAELHVSVDGQQSTTAGHLIAENVRHALFHAFPAMQEITVHVDPFESQPGCEHLVTAHHQLKG